MMFESDFKTRMDAEANEGYIEGYFVVFGQETELWPGVYEEVDLRALDDSLKTNNVLCLDNHDTRIVLGSTDSKTLELKTDNHGLYGKVKLDLEDPFAKSAFRKVSTGKVKGCSFGFNIINEEIENRDDGTVKFILREADMKEVSITAFPAYPTTEISARKQDIKQHEKRQQEVIKNKLKERLMKIC